MPDPTDYTQLDLQSLPPEEAAKLARAQQEALARQQHHALLGILGAAPELQKAGEMEYSQAGREREGGQRTAANVLRQTLEELSQKRQLAALQQQIEYQRGELGLQGQQLGASILAPLIPALLGSQTNEATIKAITGMVGGHWGEKLGNLLSTKSEAEQQVILKFLNSVGLPLGGALGKPTVGKPKTAPKETPVAPPVTEATVTPPVPAKIRVRNKQTGVPGRISPRFFDPQKYEKLPEP